MSGDQLEMTWPTAAAIGDLLDADPSHARERDEVRRAMRADQWAHGHVDPNCVRDEVASWVGPRVLAAQYGVCRRAGLLRRVGRTDNLDAKGRNTGKDSIVYEWTGDL